MKPSVEINNFADEPDDEVEIATVDQEPGRRLPRRSLSGLKPLIPAHDLTGENTSFDPKMFGEMDD